MTLTKEKLDKVKRQNRTIYMFIYTVVILFMILTNMYTSKLDFLNESNTVFIHPSDFDEDFSVYQLSKEDDHVFNYHTNIAMESFKDLKGEEYKLIINGIKDSAVKVWFNDTLIISEGDIQTGKSHLRSGHVYGSVESTMIEPNNVLKVQTYADYRTGIEEQIIISERETGDRAIRLLILFHNYFIFTGFGFMIMSVFFLLIIYFLNRSDTRLLLYLGLSTFFMSFYFFDFLPLSYLINKYIVYKKIYLLYLSIGIYFYGKALYVIIPKKTSHCYHRLNYSIILRLCCSLKT